MSKLKHKTSGSVHALQSKASITAIGSAVPEGKLTNADLERLVETSDEWIVQRTGIRERRVADEDQFTSHLSIQAVQNLIDRSGKDVTDVDLIIVATTTPDFPFPSVACQIQEAFQIRRTGAFDLNATCAGFSYALQVANGLITAGTHRKVLVIGAETLSKVTDYTDRSTCVLFGDGAGALLIEQDEQNPRKMKGQPLLGDGNMVQNGREVYKWAVQTVSAGFNELLERSNLEVDDIDWFVPHSANLRMIESICERVNIPAERLLHSLEWYGNTSSATIPLALDQALKEQKLKRGDRLLLFGFGGGLTYAGQIIEWGADGA
jgi:3-oxoacyl-[acyl-carrier-protein] synthase-3